MGFGTTGWPARYGRVFPGEQTKATLPPSPERGKVAVRVEIYTIGGMASGVLAWSGPLRDALASEDQLKIDGATWQGLDDPAPRAAGTLVVAADEILFAVANDEPNAPIHAAWHHVLLDSGPYSLEGDLATMPGFDPGRSLARPSGEFVLLRDVRLSLHGRPEAGTSVGDHALVNRYAVERIQADLMLGFFFPGATTVSASSAPVRLGSTQTAGGAA